MIPSTIPSTSSSRLSLASNRLPSSPLTAGFTGASSSTPSPNGRLEDIFNVLPELMGQYLSSQDLISMSRVNTNLRDIVSNRILPQRVLGATTAAYRDDMGQAFGPVVRQMAMLPHTLFQETDIGIDAVVYQRDRHGAFSGGTRAEMASGYGPATSVRGNTAMRRGVNSIRITRDGSTTEVMLTELSNSPALRLALSPDGRTCAALLGQLPAKLHVWRLDNTGVWRGDADALATIDGASSLTILDNGSICLLSSPPNKAGHVLHCWGRDGELRCVTLPFENPRLVAVAPDGAHFLIDCSTAEATTHTFLVALNPDASDAENTYRCCELGALSERLTQWSGPNSTTACFSPNSEVLAILCMKNGPTYLSMERVLFINVVDALAATVDGAAIDQNNQAIARWSGNTEVLPISRATMHDAALFNFLPDGMTVVRSMTTRSLGGISTNEFHFPFLSRDRAVDIASERVRAMNAEGTSDVVPAAEASVMGAEALFVTAPVAAVHPMTLRKASMCSARLGIIPGQSIVAKSRQWNPMSSTPPLQEIVTLAHRLSPGDASKARIDEQVDAIQRVANEAPVMQHLAQLRQPIDALARISDTTGLKKIHKAVGEAQKMLLKGEKKVAKVEASMALLLQPRLPVVPPTAHQQETIDHLAHLRQQDELASRNRREGYSRGIAGLMALQSVDAMVVSAKKDGRAAVEQRQREAEKEMQCASTKPHATASQFGWRAAIPVVRTASAGMSVAASRSAVTETSQAHADRLSRNNDQQSEEYLDPDWWIEAMTEQQEREELADMDFETRLLLALPPMPPTPQLAPREMDGRQATAVAMTDPDPSWGK